MNAALLVGLCAGVLLPIAVILVLWLVLWTLAGLVSDPRAGVIVERNHE